MPRIKISKRAMETLKKKKKVTGKRVAPKTKKYKIKKGQTLTMNKPKKLKS